MSSEFRIQDKKFMTKMALKHFELTFWISFKEIKPNMNIKFMLMLAVNC